MLLCFYAEGLRFSVTLLLSLFRLSFGLLPDIVYLVTVLIIVRGMGRDELRRIFVWRNIPAAVFAGILVMFYGLQIVKSELNNLFRMLFPVPEGIFAGWFYEPDNVILLIITGALFPGFSEEVFYRGILARRFSRAYSPIKSILLSATLFGLFHKNPWQAVNAFYVGIFLGWIYLRYRSIWLCIFIHAYHNFLVYFVDFPYIKVENSYYRQMWRHPLWFDILGLLLFGFGLLTVIVLSRKKGAQGVGKPPVPGSTK